MKRRTQAEMIAEGHKLIAARANVAPGKWTAWVKANREYSASTAAKYMKLAGQAQGQATPKAQAQAQAQSLDDAWARASMNDRMAWMSRVGARMVKSMAERTASQDEVMQRRGKAKGTYTYI
jgi:hypothetical protein